MNLLQEVMDHPLDPGYIAAKQRLRDRPRHTIWSTATWTIVAIVAGVALAAAVVQLRAPKPAVTETRALLASEITERRESVRSLEAQNEALHKQISTLSSQVLSAAGTATATANLGEAIALCSTPVTGEGVVAVVSDGPGADTDDAARVQDSDLQALVNQLWVSGAEAVTINGTRIGPTSAIRGAGGAILVSLVALSAPYTVQAIGSANGLQIAIARSNVADEFSQLHTAYGIGLEISGSSSISMPGAAIPALKYAKPVAD
ncbi:DUF881 domain-containing protein [Rarobacter incanus]|nr:DUF881 domain-containing protein [Rarobacter incanus]